MELVPLGVADLTPWGLVTVLVVMIVVGFMTGRVIARAVHLAVIAILQATNATQDSTIKELMKQNTALIDAGRVQTDFYTKVLPPREHLDETTQPQAPYPTVGSTG